MPCDGDCDLRPDRRKERETGSNIAKVDLKGGKHAEVDDGVGKVSEVKAIG
jgi:hypothetical protein